MVSCALLWAHAVSIGGATRVSRSSHGTSVRRDARRQRRSGGRPDEAFAATEESPGHGRRCRRPPWASDRSPRARRDSREWRYLGQHGRPLDRAQVGEAAAGSRLIARRQLSARRCCTCVPLQACAAPVAEAAAGRVARPLQDYTATGTLHRPRTWHQGRVTRKRALCRAISAALVCTQTDRYSHLPKTRLTRR